MQWPEVIQSIALQYGKSLSHEDFKNLTWAEKCGWLRCNPVVAASHFQHRLNIFFKDFLGRKANPIGKLKDYMIRIEFQARGSPHAHIILWIEDAPELGVQSDEEVAAFINEHQTCAIPDDDQDLKTLVMSVQRHVHSSTGRRSGFCRFHFPHAPSRETMIASPSDEGPEVLARKLKVSANVLGDVRKVMEDRDVPEDITLDNLLQKPT